MSIPSDSPREPETNSGEHYIEPSRVNRWLLLTTLCLVLAIGAGLGYLNHERRNTQRLALANSQLGEQLNTMRAQMSSLEANLKALSAPAPLQPAPPPEQSWSSQNRLAARAIHRPTAVRRAPVESKWERQMKQQLAEQQKQLAATQQDLAQTRAALDSGMASTHGSLNDLSGSIARNHSELVALERLGQRKYYEFDLSKSKRFEREGPISLSLRHTNTKHKNYNMVLLVDDYQLTKKNVDLYEPIRLETAESSQPLELVVNRIGKNVVHGYVSVPKAMTERTAASGGLNGVPNTGTSAGAAASSPAAAQAGEVALTRRAQPQL